MVGRAARGDKRIPFDDRRGQQAARARRLHLQQVGGVVGIDRREGRFLLSLLCHGGRAGKDDHARDDFVAQVGARGRLLLDRDRRAAEAVDDELDRDNAGGATEHHHRRQQREGPAPARAQAANPAPTRTRWNKAER